MNHLLVPTTPPVRRGFLVVLFVLCVAALLVYGVPYVADRTGYAWEAGRARAGDRGPGEARQARGSSIVPSALFRHGDDGRLAGGRQCPVASIDERGGEGFPGHPARRQPHGARIPERGAGTRA